MRCALAALLLTSLACGQEAAELGDRAAQAAWLEQHGQPPAAYVAGCFERHDVVLLGEHHLVRDNVELVAALVPVLDAAGVRVLATEFVRSAQTADVQRLVTAGEFDEELGIALQRELPNPAWGHREYLDVLRAVHAVNRTKAEGEQRFEVLGLDTDWSQAERFRSSDRMAGMRANLARERNMVEVVRREVLERDRKALVHIGWAHTIPNHGVRLATVLRDEYGTRVFPIGLHHDLAAEITERIESLCAESGGAAVGFTVFDSPFAEMRVADAMPFKMLRESTLVTFSEGWIYLRPVAELRRTTWIDGFVDAAHFEDARFVAEKMRWVDAGACETPEQLNASLAGRFDGK